MEQPTLPVIAVGGEKVVTDPTDKLDLWQLFAELQDQLATIRLATKEVEANCAKEHKKRHILACPGCYRRTVDVVQRLFEAEKQWFSGRTTFLAELRTLFTLAKTYKRHPSAADRRITEEARVWLLERCRTSPSIQALGEKALGADEFRSKLDAPDVDIVALTREVAAACAEKEPKAALSADQAAKQLADIKPTELYDRWQVFRDVVYPDGVPSERAKSDQLKRKLEDGTSVDEILRNAKVHAERNRVAQEKEKQVNRIQELKRGKAAHEAEKKKKSDKVPAAPPAAEFASVCPGCKRTSMPGDKLKSCLLCRIEVSAKVKEHDTAWCSDACFSKGFADHAQKEHKCEFKQCLDPARPYWEGVEGIETAKGRALMCIECADSFHRLTYYCSDYCARSDFQNHRETVHLPERKKHDSMIDDDDKLRKDLDNPSTYFPADLSAVVRPYAARLGVSVQEYPNSQLITAPTDAVRSR